MQQIKWEDSRAACADLIDRAQPYDEEFFIGSCSNPGFYVFVYNGTVLPCNPWEDPRPRIIYVGHNGEDSLRHWQNNTAVSTVRRSLAALLANILQLMPVPGSDDPNDIDRFSNYKLDEVSEQVLTEWMKEHISVAFWEDANENWYQALLDCAAPMFVFQNNPNNSFGAQIKSYRAQMTARAELAAGK